MAASRRFTEYAGLESPLWLAITNMPTFSVHALLFLPFLFISVRPQQPDVPLNGTCEPSSNRVDFATRKFLSDCDSRAYCDLSTQPFPTCQPKKCRRDEYPFGYDNGETFPALCASGSFCPDAQNACVLLLSIGSRCELARDGVFLTDICILFYTGPIR